MTGEYRHSLDSKGRVFIPARLREELGDVFYITLSIDKVNTMSYISQRKMRPLFAHAVKCELDAQGRVLIPQALRDYAGLAKNVAVVGCNNHAEIWDGDTWSEINSLETSAENIAAVLEELNF